MKIAPPPKNEEVRLASLRALKVLDSLPEPQYDDLVQLASTICGTPIALISLVDDGRQWFKARVGLDALQTPREVAFCAHAILEPERTFIVDDSFEDERFRDNPLVTGDPKVRFYAGAPLLSPDGMPLGTLCVLDRVPRHLSEDQEKSLEALSRQVTNLLRLRAQTVELQETNDRLTKLTGELNMSVTRFRSTFDQNTIGLTLLAPDGRFMTVNRAFAEMLGYTELELAGVHVADLTHPEDVAATVERIRHPSLTPINVSKRFLHKSGEIVWTENVARQVVDASGKPLYWLSQIQNVTARKESEDRLMAQYAMARVLAEASSLDEAAPRMLDTLCTTGKWDLAVIWELDESEATLRYAAASEIANGPPGAREALRGMVAKRGEGVSGKVWETGRSLWVEDAQKTTDEVLHGRAISLGMHAVLAVPVTVEGHLSGVVSLFAREPRSVDEPTRSLAEALCAQIGSFLVRKRGEAMQRRMVTVLENTSDFVLITTRRGRPIFVNRAGRALLEIPLDADVRTFNPDDFIPPWAAKVLREELMPTAQREGRWTGTYAYLTTSGREIPVSQVTIAPKGTDGATIFFASVARDITEAKKVERMKNEFVSTVSHELRTPLTSIRGALGLLEGGIVGKVNAEAMEIVHIALTNSDRLIRLVNDMLDLDKIEAGKLEMFLKDASAETLATSAVDSVKGMAEQAGVTLETSLEPGLCAHVDVDRTVQVITNLLSNAVKFSPRGTAVTLRASADATGERARFEVVDRGPGIPPELRARLFQKFEQLDASDSRARGGTGLGLSISKAIIEQLGGSIGVDSVPGQGSTFWLEVPKRRGMPSMRPGAGT